MKTSVIIILGAIVLLFFSCRTKKYCHKQVEIVNNSAQNVVVGTFTIGGNEGTCGYNKHVVILANSSIKYSLSYAGHDCVERSDESTLLPIYIFDQNNYSAEIVDCDSLNNKNTVLKEFNLTLENLKSNNFKLVFP